VDSGTDKVYQYDNATSRTSGSQSASTTFALAAGNTNPQGIADPPAPDTMLAPILLRESIAQTQLIRAETPSDFWGMSLAGTNGDNRGLTTPYRSIDDLSHDVLSAFAIDLAPTESLSGLLAYNARPSTLATRRTDNLFGLDLFFASLGEDSSEI
jgi:hypothetical protein